MLKALLTAEHEPYWEEYMAKHFELTKAGKNLGGQMYGADETDKIVDLLKGQDVLIVCHDVIDKYVIDNSPDLKLIIATPDGPEETTDIPACTAAGIPVISSGGRSAHAVAEMNIQLMFMMAKPVYLVNNEMHSDNKWNSDTKKYYRKKYENQCTELYNKTISIVGFGRNGKELAKKLKGFGVRVLAYDPYVTQEAADEYGVKMVDLNTAMAEGDYVTILARVTPETIGLVGKEQIDLMKPTACLINTGRGKLIDYDAALDALEENRISKIAFDVYNEEPLSDNNRIYSLDPDRVILTDHIAGTAVERAYHSYELLMPNYEKFLKGITPCNVYNPDVFNSPEFKNRGGKIFGSEK